MNKEKDYIHFLTELKVRVEAYFDGKVTGEVCTSVKNNGVIVTGLLLKGENERVAPNFYLENQYVEWMRGIQTLEEICNRLCNSYRDEVEKSRSLLTEIKFEWEEFRRKVFMRLATPRTSRSNATQKTWLSLFSSPRVFQYSAKCLAACLRSVMAYPFQIRARALLLMPGKCQQKNAPSPKALRMGN